MVRETMTVDFDYNWAGLSACSKIYVYINPRRQHSEVSREIRLMVMDDKIDLITQGFWGSLGCVGGTKLTC